MKITELWRKLWKSPKNTKAGTVRRKKVTTARIRCETLEDRITPAGYLINDSFTSYPGYASLVGNATQISSSGGYIRLTNTSRFQMGSILFPSPGRPITDMRVEFQTSIDSGISSYGDGLSLGYGPLSGGAFGENGEISSGGLWFRLDTYDDFSSSNNGSVSIWYNGSERAQWVVDKSVLRKNYQNAVLDIQPNGVFSWSFGSGGGGSFTISDWNPQPGWRFGVGARTGAATEYHDLEYLRVLDRTQPPAPSADGTSGKVRDDQPISLLWGASDPNGDLSSVSATLTLNGSTVYSSGSSGSLSSSNANQYLKNPGLGTYTLTVTASDRSHLSASTSHSYTLEDDDYTAPVVTLGGSTGSESQDAYQHFTVLCWEGRSPRLSGDGFSRYKPWSWTPTATARTRSSRSTCTWCG